MKLFMLVSTLIWSFQAFAGTSSNVNKSGVILDGYDVVSYFQSDKPVKGDTHFQAKQGDVVFWFSSQANKDEFQKNPKKYEPQYGGWCAYAIADSKSKVDVDPQSFLIQDGRLLLFYKGLWGNTREKWLHTKDKDSKAYLKEADTNWPQVMNQEP